MALMVDLSVLDLSPIVVGGDAAQSLRNSRDLAQNAERFGYKRFWLAEHHNMAGVASAATSVVIGYVAEGTSTIRVGAGGVMLPNHADRARALGDEADRDRGGRGRDPGHVVVLGQPEALVTEAFRVLRELTRTMKGGLGVAALRDLRKVEDRQRHRDR